MDAIPIVSLSLSPSKDSTCLFFKIWRNNYLRSNIIQWLPSINHCYDISEYYLYYDNSNSSEEEEEDGVHFETKGFDENDCDNESYFIYDDIVELKSKLKIKSYSEANDLLWLIKNKHFPLLKDKLIMHKIIKQQQQSNSKNGKKSFNNNLKNFKLNITENSIYNFCLQNKDINIFKLFFEVYGNEYFCTENTKIMEKVVQSGSLEIVKYLIQKGFKFDSESIHFSISFGFFKVFKFLMESMANSTEISLESNTIDFARGDPVLVAKKSSTGQDVIKLRNIGLKILHYLHEIYPDIEYSQQAVDYSCVSGNLKMVEFYGCEKGLLPSEKGIQGAIIGNHLNLLRYFKEKNLFRESDMYTFGIDQAIAKGHMEAIKFMHRNLNRKWSHEAIGFAAKFSKFEILEYMYKHDQDLFKEHLRNTRVLKKASSGGDRRTIEYLMGLGFAGSEHLIIKASKKNNVELVEFFFDRFKTSVPFSNKSIDYSIQNNSLEMFKALMKIKGKYNSINYNSGYHIEISGNFSNGNSLKLNKYVMQCIRNKNLVLLKYVVQHFHKEGLRITSRKENLLLFAAQHDLSIVKYLLTLPGFKVTPNIIFASKNRRMAKFLYSMYDGHSPMNSLVFENSINHSNLNLLKYHIQKIIIHKKSLGETVSIKDILSEKEVSKIASLPNNAKALKYIHRVYKIPFSNQILRDSCSSNSLENVKYVNEVLESQSVKKYIMDSAIDSLEIVKYLNFHSNQECSTKAIEEAAHLENYMTVKFLLENRKEGFTNNARLKAESFPSILKLLKDHNDLLKKQ
ncbi:hypothetical protein DICPUDRAFT_40972 [Dictyostelium purpureum]|uniref:Uncharacterized protein n=1 Tax=Dictyostelium purpureum TaxID=5786 RepID=F0ZZ62_DICPU|nr:uncharacterized protein DICPUDRAFT_40972 [Dictyostelium purpureum]EGC30765.1 hypothetical protein DICPUDRAFT_40972 [Dictyostelium purpureum]|eukprot:XP_003292705.1 hypothetical protein DICPUDRAFT_40972 [Dictyostelium purpureum]